MKTICIEADSAQGAMINCSNKIQTKASERDQTREERLTALRVGGAGRAAMTEW